MIYGYGYWVIEATFHDHTKVWFANHFKILLFKKGGKNMKKIKLKKPSNKGKKNVTLYGGSNECLTNQAASNGNCNC